MNDEAREVELAAEVAHADLAGPNIARMYDCILGRSANFEVDRAAADQAPELVPTERDYSASTRGRHGRCAALEHDYSLSLNCPDL
jgi:hypothetical protein